MLTVMVLVAIQIRLAFIHPEEIPFSNKCLGNPAAALLSSWQPNPPEYGCELSFSKGDKHGHPRGLSTQQIEPISLPQP